MVPKKDSTQKKDHFKIKKKERIGLKTQDTDAEDAEIQKDNIMI